VIALVVALAFPAAAPAVGSAPTPTTPSPTPPTTSTAAPAPTSPSATPGQPHLSRAQSQPDAPAAKEDRTGRAAVWLAAILAALLVLSAVFAGLAWWFGWSVERFVGRRGASWDGLGEFSDWIRTGQ
jgi:hypothetical protein